MEEGPFRVSRPADRRVVSRQPEPAYRQPEAPQQPMQDDPRMANRAPAPHHIKVTEKSSKRWMFIVGAIILVAVLGVGGWLAFTGNRSGSLGIDSGRYQAVFFTNGQVYFGKLKPLSNDHMKLTDIYYLQTQAKEATSSPNPQETSTEQSNVQLIKLGAEIHGPEDEMVISKDQMLFFENLKTDSKVVQSIAASKKSNK